jgi:predicted neuraminidase
MPLHRAAVLLALLPLLAAVPAPPPPAAARCDAVRLSEFIYQTAPYPQAHASTIVETRAGTIAAAWFGGTHERHPDVEIRFARHTARGWETPVSVANGIQPDGSRLPTWNPVLFQDPHGPLLLFYKIGPSLQGWWGMVIASDDDGRTWSRPRRLPDGILGPIKNKPVALPDGSWLAPSSVETTGDGPWKLHFERSTDAGRSWTATPPVDPGPSFDAIQPSVLFLRDGTLEAVARTRQGVLAATRSSDGGKSWSKLFAIDLPNPNSGTDAVTLKDGRQLIVYNHSAQSPDTPGKGVRYPLNIGLSDDGVHWRNVLTLESAPMKDGYAYPAVIQASDGLVHVTYTWNRQRIRHVVIDPKQLCDGGGK